MSRITISNHAIERFRERVPDGPSIEERVLLAAIKKAVTGKNYADTPGGRFFPLSFGAFEGYAVTDKCDKCTVTTVMPKEWCQDINDQFTQE